MPSYIIVNILLALSCLLTSVSVYGMDGKTEDCMQKRKPPNIVCDSYKTYSNFDGKCNNLVEKDAGSYLKPLKRLLPPNYGDGIEAPRRATDGSYLPSARVISNAFAALGVEEEKPVVFSHMFVQLGQFLAHDTSLTPMMKEANGEGITCNCTSTRPECIKIEIPPYDFYMNQRSCIPMVRSAKVQGTGCHGKPRQQMNAITAFFDGNTIYDNTERRNMMLRNENSDSGEFLVRTDDTAAIRDPRTDSIILNTKINTTVSCPKHLTKGICFVSGEKRANENIGLVSMHILFVREHNRMARRLKALNPHWSSDTVYMETRRIISAITQVIAYREFVPALVGRRNVKIYDLATLTDGFYNGYDATYDATISNVWATAAFRYGHSMVKKSLSQLNSVYEEEKKPIEMHKALFNPSYLMNISAHRDSFLFRGLLQDSAEPADTFMTEQLRSQMFKSETKVGVDLFSLNTERGRDHGLPGYNAWREYCGLKFAIDFNDLSNEISEKKIEILSALYKNVNDIDVFVGGLAENNLRNSAVGPTFACLNSIQFRDIKKGDRMWHENPGVFSYDQLQEIRKVTLASILCSNVVGMETVQPWTMYIDSYPGNDRIPCSRVGQINLQAWQSKSTVRISGTYTRWFPQEENANAIETLRVQLMFHKEQVCATPLDSQVKNFTRIDENTERKIVRYKCPHGSITVSDAPNVPDGYFWTQWFDRDSPDNHGDDDESLASILAERPRDVCKDPLHIQAKTIKNEMALEKGETLEYYCAPKGLICKKEHQSRGKCSDYAVRFLCPKKFFENRKIQIEMTKQLANFTWTTWMNSDNENGRGDFESPGVARLMGYSICNKPRLLEARVVGTNIAAEDSGDVLKRFSMFHGLVCLNTDQPDGRCRNYEVRYLCPDYGKKLRKNSLS